MKTSGRGDAEAMGQPMRPRASAGLALRSTHPLLAASRDWSCMRWQHFRQDVSATCSARPGRRYASRERLDMAPSNPRPSA